MRTTSKVLAATAVAAVLGAVIFAVGGWQCVGLSCARDGGRIDAIETHAEILADGTVNVVEHVTFTFDKPQTGLHFDLPSLQREGGKWYRAPIVVHTVRAESDHVLDHAEGAAGHSLRVWIGDPKKSYVGTHTFLITYVMQGALRKGVDRDELRWSPVGPDTSLPVAKVSADVTVPANVSMDSATAACDVDCAVIRNERSFHVTHAGPLSLLVGLPAGAVPVAQFGPVSALAPFLPYTPYAAVALFSCLVLIRVWKEKKR